MTVIMMQDPVDGWNKPMMRATNLKPEEVPNRYPSRNRESLSVTLSPWRRKQQNIDQQEKGGEEMKSEICGASDQHIPNNIFRKKKKSKNRIAIKKQPCHWASPCF